MLLTCKIKRITNQRRLPYTAAFFFMYLVYLYMIHQGQSLEYPPLLDSPVLTLILQPFSLIALSSSPTSSNISIFICEFFTIVLQNFIFKNTELPQKARMRLPIDIGNRILIHIYLLQAAATWINHHALNSSFLCVLFRFFFLFVSRESEHSCH